MILNYVIQFSERKHLKITKIILNLDNCSKKQRPEETS